MSSSSSSSPSRSNSENREDQEPHQESDWHVRQGQMEDATTLLSFTLDEAVEAEGRVENQERVHKAIRLALEDPKDKALYLVVSASQDSQTLVGHCSITREWSDWNCAHYWWISSMYVRPQDRGKGAMQALLAEVDRRAKIENVPEVRIYVHKSNQRATRAWNREGFLSSEYWMGSRKVL